jgi:hypothetical protein
MVKGKREAVQGQIKLSLGGLPVPDQLVFTTIIRARRYFAPVVYKNG